MMSSPVSSVKAIEDFLNNDNIISSLGDGMKIDTDLLTLLEGIVEKQQLGEDAKVELENKIKAIQEFKPAMSQAEVEKALKAFQEEAIKAYQRVASSTVSIIEGELSALTTGVPGAFGFGEEVVKELFAFNKTTDLETDRYVEAYEQQIEDTIKALEFMLVEIGLVKELLNKSANEVNELLGNDVQFSVNPEVAQLMNATSSYLDILSDDTAITDSLRNFRLAEGAISKLLKNKKEQGVLQEEEDRIFGKHVIEGMVSFCKFACRLSEAEGDLNKINEVDGAGVVRRALSRAFNDIILIDQKFYPMNNQIPLPPITVSPVVINEYLEAYEERARELVTASANQVNQINNKFDRKIANAQRNINQLSETLLLPKPAARSSISREQVVDAVETPKAFFSRTTGIPLNEVDANLEARRATL